MRVLRISHSAVVDAWRERERALGRLGVDVALLSARRWNEGGTDMVLHPRPGENVRGLRTWGGHPALFLYNPRELWRALASPWDLIDIHEEPYALATAEILLLRLLRRRRAPYTLYSAQNLEKRYPPPFRWTERWALRNASGVSVCNKRAGEILTRKGLSARPTLIGLGVDTGHLRPATPEDSPSRPEGGPPVVGYIGRLESHKGVDLLLRAVASDDMVTARVAGDGPAVGDLRALSAHLGIESRVEFTGPIGQAALPDFYRSIDVLAVPSRTTPGWVEQFGRVAVEAMACGTPVVASRTGALPDVVGGAGILVEPDDSHALLNGIREAVRAPTRQPLVTAGLMRAQRFTWTAVAHEYRDMYHRAVHAPQRGQVAPPVEVVVVAYGAPDLLARALEPLTGMPVTVVDNSSSLAVKRVCADAGARYVDPGVNGGFAAGVNAFLQDHHDPDSDVLLLNPDAVIEPDQVDLLRWALHEDPDLASVAPRQSDPGGAETPVSWPFPSPWGAWLDALGLGRWRRGERFVIGSVLLLRAEALVQVGALDDSFFLYAEETDWAYRARRLGWHHALVTEAKAEHVGSGTSTDSTRREVFFHASQERYLRKHFGSLGWQVARGAQIVGSALRAAAPGPTRRRQARMRLHMYVHGGPLSVEERHLPSDASRVRPA